MSVVVGDIDASGAINIVDVIQLIHVILESQPYDSVFDINSDQQINVLDAVVLINRILQPSTDMDVKACEPADEVQLLQDHYADQTLVRFVTNLLDPTDAGHYLSVDVALYDEETPHSAANFLSYVNTDQYDGLFVHRSLPGFVVQSGGFTFDGVAPTAVVTNPTVVNEFNYSNLTGTLAMAKFGGDPDSATSQFFFNLADNSANLDNQNGGFTVFAEVLGDGMSVINTIASLNTYDLDGDAASLDAASLYDNVPVLDGSLPTLENNLVTFTEVSVITPQQHYAWLENSLADAVTYIEQLTGQPLGSQVNCDVLDDSEVDDGVL